MSWLELLGGLMLILIGATGLRSWRAARRRRNGEKIAPKNTSALGFDRLVARPRR
jgi:threonine efflux protein